MNTPHEVDWKACYERAYAEYLKAEAALKAGGYERCSDPAGWKPPAAALLLRDKLRRAEICADGLLEQNARLKQATQDTVTLRDFNAAIDRADALAKELAVSNRALSIAGGLVMEIKDDLAAKDAELAEEAFRSNVAILALQKERDELRAQLDAAKKDASDWQITTDAGSRHILHLEQQLATARTAMQQAVDHIDHLEMLRRIEGAIVVPATLTNEILKAAKTALAQIAPAGGVAKPLTWTKEKPTAPGWYWWRRTYWRNHPIYIAQGNDGLEHEEDGTRVEELSGEFAGPIPEPVESPG